MSPQLMNTFLKCPVASPLPLQAGFLLFLSGGKKAVHNSTYTRQPVALTFCHQCQCGQSLTIILIVEEQNRCLSYLLLPFCSQWISHSRLLQCTFQVSRLQLSLYLQAQILILGLNKFIGNWKHTQLITARVKCKPSSSQPLQTTKGVSSWLQCAQGGDSSNLQRSSFWCVI